MPAPNQPRRLGLARLSAPPAVAQPLTAAVTLGAAARLPARRSRRRSTRERSLERMVAARTRELQLLLQQLRCSQATTIRHLARAVEACDSATHDHIGRIGEIAALLTRALGWQPDEVELMRLAAPMHDVGKIAIPDRILLKPGPLSALERTEMQRHTTIGHQILSDSDCELLELASSIALTHHERFDGEGYPRRLRGPAIPIAGRVCAVADVFDALTHDRVYRPAMAVDQALEIMRAGRGTQFDPDVLDELLNHLDEILNL
jgi:putative two-component system response regulator